MDDLVNPCLPASRIVVFGNTNWATQIIVHRSELRGCSRWFGNLTKRENRDDKIRVVEVSHEDAEYFSELENYLLYLRTGGIVSAELNWSSDSIWAIPGSYRHLFNIHALGCKIDDTKYQDAVLDAIISVYRGNAEPCLPSDETINQAYANTISGSPLRKLLVDLHLWTGFKTLADSTAERLNASFIEDLFEAAKKRSEAIDTTQKLAGVSCCDYHVHKEDEACGNKKRKHSAIENSHQADPAVEEQIKRLKLQLAELEKSRDGQHE